MFPALVSDSVLSETTVDGIFLYVHKRLRTAVSRHCENSAYIVHFFSGTIYSRGLKFLQVIYESFYCDLTQGFLNRYDLFMPT